VHLYLCSAHADQARRDEWKALFEAVSGH
jgi:hypothetical protein